MCFQASHFPWKNTISIDDWCCNSNLSGSFSIGPFVVRYLKLGRANGSRRICQKIDGQFFLCQLLVGRSNGRFSCSFPHAWLAMNIDEHDTVNDHVGISSRFAWFVWLVTAGGVKCRNSTCFHQSWWRCCRDVPCCLDSVAFMVGPWRPWSSKKLQQRAPVKIKWLGRFHSLHLFPPYQALLLVD